MRNMLVVLAALSMVIISGCGGGEEGEGHPAEGHLGGGTGSVTLSVAWPEAEEGIEPSLLPVASNSISARVVDRNSELVSEVLTIARPTTQGTLRDVPTGNHTLKVEAYPTSNGTGVAQARADQLVTVTRGDNSPARITLASTIDRVQVSPDPASVQVGGSVQLTATAKDSDGQTVLVRSNEPFRWTIPSGSQRINVGQFTGRVTGVAQGSAVVRATEQESGVSGTASVQVTEEPTSPPPTVNLTSDETTIHQGESTTLRWSSTNATRVVSSNFGATGVNGSKTVSPNSTTTYEITVEGPGGQVSDDATVWVIEGGGDEPWERPGTHVGQEIVGPAGIPLVWVPSGSFMMGSEDGWNDEKPVRQVNMSGFWIGKYQVTVAQWRSVMGSVPRPNDQQGDDHPVVCVSWHDVQGFCEQVGLELPTEAQWEYAARGPESLRYPWGNEWDGSKLCWWDNKGPGGRTFPVGSFPEGASWVGALDMAGNVLEWCADWYHDDYYASAPSTDPPGPSSGSMRVLRGGSWPYLAFNCRSAYRRHNTPDATFLNYGFRVARSCR